MPDKEYYDLLEIPQNADIDMIKKAYRKMAIKYHPDKNPNNKQAEETFKKIGEAYEILSDPEKRKIYDNYGKDGLSNNNMNIRPEDIFAQFFGNSFNPFGGSFGSPFGNSFSQPNKRKGENTIKELHIGLDDLYKGHTYKFNITRDIICSSCDGTGALNKSSMSKCNICNGNGIKIVRIQHGPIIQQIQTQCDNCNGTGEKILEENKCKKCKGLKIIPDKKNFEFHVKAGTEDNEQIIFKEESDQRPNMTAGDLIFVLKQKPHNLFTRKHNDLYMKKNISLIEALIGATFKIDLFGVRQATVGTNTIINPNEILILKNYGMPIKGTVPQSGTPRSTTNYGNLYIEFNIIFPTKLSEKQINSLNECFEKNLNNTINDKIIYLTKN